MNHHRLLVIVVAFFFFLNLTAKSDPLLPPLRFSAKKQKTGQVTFSAKAYKRKRPLYKKKRSQKKFPAGAVRIRNILYLQGWHRLYQEAVLISGERLLQSTGIRGHNQNFGFYGGIFNFRHRPSRTKKVRRARKLPNPLAGTYCTAMAAHGGETSGTAMMVLEQIGELPAPLSPKSVKGRAVIRIKRYKDDPFIYVRVRLIDLAPLTHFSLTGTFRHTRGREAHMWVAGDDGPKRNGSVDAGRKTGVVWYGVKGGTDQGSFAVFLPEQVARISFNVAFSGRITVLLKKGWSSESTFRYAVSEWRGVGDGVAHRRVFIKHLSRRIKKLKKTDFSLPGIRGIGPSQRRCYLALIDSARSLTRRDRSLRVYPSRLRSRLNRLLRRHDRALKKLKRAGKGSRKRLNAEVEVLTAAGRIESMMKSLMVRWVKAGGVAAR